MSRRNSKNKALATAWIVTALAAVVVMIIYVIKIQKINRVVDEIAQTTTVVQDGGELPSLTDTPDITGADDIEQKEPEEDVTAADADVSEDEVQDTAGAGLEDNAESSGEDAPYYYDPDLDPSRPIIAFTFDDGPSQYTDRILETLDKYGAKATFFMVGYNLDYYKDQVVNVYNAGCEIGNHTTAHDNLNKGTKEQIKKWVFNNEDKINEIVPVGEMIVRPPYGNHNETVREVVDRPMFCWSVDSRDWETRNAESIVKQIKQDAKDGYIILMHDIYESTADAVDVILPWLIDQGYQVTCISNMFEARGEEIKGGHVYRYTSPAPVSEE